MDLELFLAAMHDRMVPAYIRHTMDAVDSDIRLDFVVQAAQRIFADDKRSAGVGPNAHESNDFMPTTRADSEDFKLPGGYSEEHWRDVFSKTDKAKEDDDANEKAKEEEERKRQEEEEKQREEARTKHAKDNLSAWMKQGGPIIPKEAQELDKPEEREFSENEFVLN